jgi:hypothetical protein
MLIAIGILVCAVFIVSALVVAREPTPWSALQLLGAGFLAVMVFSHVAERLGLFPTLDWGQPNSVGHYIDLVSAVSGSILVPAGYIGRRLLASRSRHIPAPKSSPTRGTP